MRSNEMPGHDRVDQTCRRSSSAAAGAGPSRAIASTNATNDPDRRRLRISTLSISLPAANTNRRPDQRQRCPVLGMARQRGADGSRDEDSAVNARHDRASSRHSPVVGTRTARLNPHAASGESHYAVRNVQARVPRVRRRLEPLRVRPFGRLLGSYTVNDLGDTIGVIALSILVYDQTESVAPTAGFFLFARFLPALLATGLTAQLDRYGLRRTLPSLYVVEALIFVILAFLADGDRFFLPLVLALGAVDGTLAITGRGLTRGAVAVLLQPKDLLTEGNALMNLGFAASSVFGAALAGGLIAAFGVSVGPAGRRRLVRADRGRAGGRARPARARARGPHAVAGAVRRRARVRARLPAGAHAAGRAVAGADLLHDRRADRGHLRQGEPRDDQRRLRDPDVLVGRRHRDRQPAVPRCSSSAPGC